MFVIKKTCFDFTPTQMFHSSKKWQAVLASHHNSFIFSNHFILVRVAVNLEPIESTLDMRQKYTLVRATVHCSDFYLKNNVHFYFDLVLELTFK